MLEGQTLDFWGLILLFFGLVAALSIYIHVTGPLGRGIDAATGWLFGLTKLAIPPAAVAAGVALVQADEDEYDIPLPYVVGALMAIMSTTGFLHLFRGRPPWGSSADVFGGAGGVFGLGVAGPLVSLAATFGAILVLLTMALLAFVILSRTPVRDVAEAAASGLRPMGDALRGNRYQTRDGIEIEGELEEIDLTDMAPLDFASEPVSELDDETQVTRIEVEPRPEPEPEPETEPEPEPEDASPALFDQDRPTPLVNVPQPSKPAKDVDLEVRPAAGQWVLPPLKLLRRSSTQSVDTVAVEERGRVLEAALAEHGVETRLVGMTVGPTVTRFELELGRGVKVSKVTSLQNDIAYAMASPDVRILAPIPGRQAIGVEVPNTKREVVCVGDILTSPEAREANHPLEVAVGRDINGRSILINLATLPHILIAGQTGAGKSSGLNSIITSIMMRATPDDVRMVLIDPKRVEMGQYDRIPHLLTAPVTDPKKAANALAWAVREMERRYDLLSDCGFRDMTGYNEAVLKGDIEAKPGQVDADGEPMQFKKLPYIMVVVDELADLMMVAARDVEESICRLAQMARAVGIHLIIATQRPSVNVITGLIKANVPARMSFKVSSLTDSRVILDTPGAERLVGKGDMLLLSPSSPTPNRIQGCWVEESEVRKIVKHWRAQAPEVSYESSVAADDSAAASPQIPETDTASIAMATVPLPEQGTASSFPSAPAASSPGDSLSMSITDDPPAGFAGGDEDDEMLISAMELVVNSQLGSTSMLQRKLRVGFARAGRLMDLLEERGVVGPSEGSKARAVLITPEQLAASRNA